MAVKTPFANETLSTILAAYNVGTLIRSEPFAHGADQTNILLVTSTGKYAFRYYEKRPLDYVLFEIDLLHYLG